MVYDFSARALQLSFVLPPVNQCSSYTLETIPEDSYAPTEPTPTEGTITQDPHALRRQLSRLASLADGIVVLNLAASLICAIAQPRLPALRSSPRASLSFQLSLVAAYIMPPIATTSASSGTPTAIPLIATPTVSSGFNGEEFINNLGSDLAPLLTLFGEQVTKQFLSMSLGWADHILLAVGPLGIITIMVSAIRVSNVRTLKAIVGRWVVLILGS